MTIQFACDDKQTLIAYLYGEIDPAARRAVDEHLALCSACAAEAAALGGVRSELGLWMPPHAELDFAIVKKSELPPSNVLRPARWWNAAPVWAQAAAAVLVLAAGAAIANLQVKSGPDGFSVSTGWIQERTLGAPAQGADAGSEVEGWRPALAAMEQQLRSEIRSTRDQAAPASGRGSADDAIMRRVQQLITEAEKRHSQELAARLIDFTRDVNMQRRADLMNISRGMVSYEEQLQRQRQMINNVYRVSATPQQ
jgi:hypothetical protein